MKLQRMDGDTVTGEAVALSDEMLWVDEFAWSKVAMSDEYTIAGAFIVEQSEKLAGRTITIERPDDNAGWTTKSTVQTLYEWSNIAEQRFKLTLEHPNKREFVVIFDTNNPIEAEPVKGFVGTGQGAEPYFCNLKFLEVKS